MVYYLSLIMIQIFVTFIIEIRMQFKYTAMML